MKHQTFRTEMCLTLVVSTSEQIVAVFNFAFYQSDILARLINYINAFGEECDPSILRCGSADDVSYALEQIQF